MWSDNETKTDLLGFQHLSNAVVSIIRRDHLLPATVGVYGDWGSGKSSLVQVIQAGLEKEEDVVVLFWEHAIRDDADYAAHVD